MTDDAAGPADDRAEQRVDGTPATSPAANAEFPPAGAPTGAATAAGGSGERLAGLISAHVRDVPDYPSPGILFKDITPLLATPEVFAAVVEGMAAPHRAGTELEVDAVAGIEARGFILAAPVALALGVPFVPIRKKGKLPYSTLGAEYDLEYGTASIEVHTDAVRPGARVLVVDDVLATGGTAAAACELIERLGAAVTSLTFLLELGFLSGRDKLPGRPLRTLSVA